MPSVCIDYTEALSSNYIALLRPSYLAIFIHVSVDIGGKQDF